MTGGEIATAAGAAKALASAAKVASQDDESLKQQLREKAKDSAVLAANQGLYNGFLAAGLVWGLLEGASGSGLRIKTFFLLCVVIAGVYGALTVSRRILYVQAAPAVIALLLLWSA